ncbi:MAG: response regulator transcription factor [Nitrospirae bacterium]|nr:response regulator transcription factor [Nitrospirota bacterium]
MMLRTIKKRVLVVDGDPFYCTMMVSALRQAGYLSSACQENEALATIKKTGFDLVLIDMGMFSISARDLVKQLRQKKISIPIFTVADPADKMFIIDLLRNGHRDIIENYIARAS